ncbi:hypothetical protein JCM16303_000203 [Sporobolomyces ruberrimus]
MTSPGPEAAEDRSVKRRRTSSGSASDSSTTLQSQSPRTAESVTRAKTETSKGKSRAERLAGFDDEEEPEVAPQDLDHPPPAADQDNDDQDEDVCAICLAPIDNKTVVYPCHHGQFCWNCIRAWTDQSRKCPLCLGPIEHLIHNIRSAKDYSTYHLLPLHTLTSSSSNLPPLRSSRRPPPPSPSTSSLPRHALYGRQSIQTLDTPTPRERLEEIALERRKYIYREGLYAKHVASNRYTGFKPFSPQVFNLNQELKAKVIKFIRRELQVFPAVDVSFLTTYLISIASQLDLRSPAALRLVSDFLSDSDAQHLVHEVVTFARSPFSSLEGYDRFIQYGRPEKRVEEELGRSGGAQGGGELEKMVFEEPNDTAREDGGKRLLGELSPVRRRREEEPRFARNMRNRRDEEEEETLRRKGRRYSDVDRRPRSVSPAESLRRSYPNRDDRDGRKRRPSLREKEPDWRDRDERFTGSYYRHSDSRMDRGKHRNIGRGYVDERRERRNSMRRDRRESFGSYKGDRGRGYSRSPSPFGRDDRRRSRSRSAPRRRSSVRPRSNSPRAPSRDRRPRSRSRSRARSGLSHLPSRRSRSPTPTRANLQSQRTPTPPPQPLLPHVDDSEYQDAISLSAPALSPALRSPRDSSISNANAQESEPVAPAGEEDEGGGRDTTRQSVARPTLSIFGAARRLLGNGNIVTFSDEGKIQLQVAGGSRVRPFEASAARGTRAGKGKGTEEGMGRGRDSNKEKRILEDRYQPVATPGPSQSLLSRLGPPRLLDATSTISSEVVPSADDATDPSSSTAPTLAMRLKAKLQERLTAEYRQALSKLSSSNSTTALDDSEKPRSLPGTTAGGGKVDLRSLLQSRLQAEKALAYDAQQRLSSSPSVSTSTNFSTHLPSDSLNSPMRTTFSQATKDLLLMRLEEERLLAQEQQTLYDSSTSSVLTNDYDADYYPSFTPEVMTSSRSLPVPTLTPTVTTALKRSTSTSQSTEMDLKTKLLEKRKLVVEEELKKRSGELKEKLMREKLLKQMQKKKT